MWRVLVPLSLFAACFAGIRRERRELRNQLRQIMSAGEELAELSEQAKARTLEVVSSVDALARLDEPTWLHRNVLTLRRRSSLRERVLCTCSGRESAALCAAEPGMLCGGRHDRLVLLASRKIPFRVQERPDEPSARVLSNSAAPPSTFGRCFNGDGERASSK